MGKSHRLRHQDLRKIYRLIGECRDLGADPIAWRRRLLEGAITLTGARAAYSVHLLAFPGPAWVADAPILLGLEAPRHTDLFNEHIQHMADHGDPMLEHFAALSLHRTQTRIGYDVLNLNEWYRSEPYQRFHRPMDLDPGILSMCPVRAPGEPTESETGSPRSLHTLTVRRGVGEPWFSRRDVRLMHWLHHELSREIGRHIALPREPSPSQLPPRMRQTLHHLLTGQSEKQIASDMNISRATVHEYVTGIYRRFGVDSRSELMARWIRYAVGSPYNHQESRS